MWKLIWKLYFCCLTRNGRISFIVSRPAKYSETLSPEHSRAPLPSLTYYYISILDFGKLKGRFLTSERKKFRRLETLGDKLSQNTHTRQISRMTICHEETCGPLSSSSSGTRRKYFWSNTSEKSGLTEKKKIVLFFEEIFESLLFFFVFITRRNLFFVSANINRD